ncbi:peptidase domain-containing ABC transporter [Erythrobacter rubeus]|uniref:Peptidase domain-containing ABC transporter n=1 Tax=Erythrobacter rubeus TaxID=2760803 RepID=A0ABR8KNT7_9SPHN|nr:peptidase domain-containing ABC transporter [Erythrobacter rubeus]MBD2840967.1 peptidase domain-containing ABC transporter [Erythrobacter rubeus]
MNSPVDLIEFSGRRRTPYLPQGEASECALACLAMVAGFHGYKTDLIALRQRFGMSLKGANLKQIMEVAEDVGFNARPLRGDIDDLPHLSMPAILHWNLNHFVVLTAVTGGVRRTRYHMHDPARGAIVLSEAEVSRCWTGVALELLPSESFQPKIDRKQMNITQLWSKMTGFWGTIRQVVLLSLVMQLVVLATPFFLQISIDTVFPAFDTNLLLMLALGFGGLTVVNLLASWLRSLILVTLSNSLSYQVITNLFRHLVRLPLDYFEKRHVGDIISRFGSTQPISQLISQGMIAAFIDGLMAILTLALMFIYSPLLGGVACAALTAYAGLRLAFLQSIKLRNLDVITTMAKENTNFIESVRGISAIKAFGQEGNRQRLWQKSKADAVNAQVKLGRLQAAFDALGQFVIGIERVIFVYVAIGLAFDSILTVGMIFAFQAYKQQFLDAGMRLTEQAINYQIVKVHLTRIADIALSPLEENDEDKGNENPDFTKPLALSRVYYRYGSNEQMVLQGVNLKIEPGEFIAITGPSGGGKTTLMKVLMGLFEPTQGEVRLGTRPISSYRKAKYRRAIGSVAQGDMLYAGSLAENIAFFDPELNMVRVREVARMAQIDADIEAMAMGYETLVGDMGSVLSGGQLQRVLLARALYPDPKLLILDEGTANLDAENEAKILDALKGLEITRIAVAHRPATLKVAERVFECRGGYFREQPNGPQRSQKASEEIKKLLQGRVEGKAQPKRQEAETELQGEA